MDDEWVREVIVKTCAEEGHKLTIHGGEWYGFKWSPWSLRFKECKCGERHRRTGPIPVYVGESDNDER